jgi:ribosomal protein L21E
MFKRGDIVMIMADPNHKGYDDKPYYGYVDGWVGKVAGNTAGLFEVKCREQGARPDSAGDPEALPLTLLVPASELRILHA